MLMFLSSFHGDNYGKISTVEHVLGQCITVRNFVFRYVGRAVLSV